MFQSIRRTHLKKHPPRNSNDEQSESNNFNESKTNQKQKSPHRKPRNQTSRQQTQLDKANNQQNFSNIFQTTLKTTPNEKNIILLLDKMNAMNNLPRKEKRRKLNKILQSETFTNESHRGNETQDKYKKCCKYNRGNDTSFNNSDNRKNFIFESSKDNENFIDQLSKNSSDYIVKSETTTESSKLLQTLENDFNHLPKATTPDALETVDLSNILPDAATTKSMKNKRRRNYNRRETDLQNATDLKQSFRIQKHGEIFISLYFISCIRKRMNSSNKLFILNFTLTSRIFIKN